MISEQEFIDILDKYGISTYQIYDTIYGCIDCTYPFRLYINKERNSTSCDSVDASSLSYCPNLGGTYIRDVLAVNNILTGEELEKNVVECFEKYHSLKKEYRISKIESI